LLVEEAVGKGQVLAVELEDFALAGIMKLRAVAQALRLSMLCQQHLQ
jgi:hypothetical protein